MERRAFLKFAGLVGMITGGVQKAFAAGTWQKVGAANGTPGTWQKITAPKAQAAYSASGNNSAVLRSDGTIYACGYNTYGCLSNGSVSNISTYKPTIGISNVVQFVYGPSATTSALRADGTVWNAGYGAFGTMGINNAIASNTKFVSAIGISNAVAVACGYNIATALRSDGTVWSCGYGLDGDLGINNAATRLSTYTQALGISSAVAIALGNDIAIAVRSDGTVWTAGYNLYGSLGNNSFGAAATALTYVSAIGISQAIAVAAGAKHAIALRADGTVWGCGYDGYGQLGNNSIANPNKTYVSSVGISNAVAIAAGFYHSVALRADGFVFCTGLGSKGQLGQNSTATKSVYTSAVGISNIVSITAGHFHTVAVRSDGAVFACGYNGYGELGVGIATTSSALTFTQVVGV